MRPIRLFFFLALLSISYISYAGGPQLIGMTSSGGINGGGSIIRYTGGDTSINMHYNLATNANPGGSFIQASNGLMYGMTSSYGTSSFGTLFEYNYVADTFILLVNFDSISGGQPNGSLSQASDGKLYGLTYIGGSKNGGTLFSYTIGTNSVTVLQNLSATAQPLGSVIQSSNGKIYGLTRGDGTNNSGTIFEYDIFSNIFSLKYNLPPNALPAGSLLEAGVDTLYGMTYYDGLDSGGTLFRYLPNTNAYDTLFSFHHNSFPNGSLMRASDGKLYGMLSDVAGNNNGNLFSYDILSGIYTDIYDCSDPIQGKNPEGILFQANDSLLYGMTIYGGTNGYGTIFRYDIPTSLYTKEVDLNNTTGDYPRGGSFIEYNPYLGTGITTIPESNIKIYGKTGVIAIEGPDNSPATVIVTNILGQQVVNTTTNSTSVTLPISTTDAIYIVQVIQGSNQTIKKVFVR